MRHYASLGFVNVSRFSDASVCSTRSLSFRATRCFFFIAGIASGLPSFNDANRTRTRESVRSADGARIAEKLRRPHSHIVCDSLACGTISTPTTRISRTRCVGSPNASQEMPKHFHRELQHPCFILYPCFLSPDERAEKARIPEERNSESKSSMLEHTRPID